MMFSPYPRTLPILIVQLLALCSHVTADARNYNPTGEGCVDPDGFLSCYKSNEDQAVSCLSFCDTTPGTIHNNCILGCSNAQLASNIGCWIQGCWNQVYSCEYQLTAISYFSGTDLVQSGVIPFYPPPEDAGPGACSCNLGYVYGNLTHINMNNACIDVATSGDFDALYTCQCCQFSVGLSNTLNACPKSDLSIFDINTKIANTISLIGNSNDNCSILETNPDYCTGTLGYEFDVGRPIYNALNLTDEPGTEPLSNNEGNPFTEFGAPAYTLKLFPAVTTTITPAPFDAKAAAAPTDGGVGDVTISDTGSATGTAGATATGVAAGTAGSKTTTAAGSGLSSPAAATPTKNGAAAAQAQNVLLVGGIAVAILQMLL